MRRPRELWNPGRGMLCIGCLEERIGRQLCSDDFIDVRCNRDTRKRSSRLIDRMAA